MAQLEIKKMKQGMSYSRKEKTIILNVFKYFRGHFPEKCVTAIVRRTAKATGCSEKSIFQFRKEEASAEGFKEPSKTKVRKNININSRDIKYDFGVRQAIRNIIYDLKYKNIVPSLNTILKQVNADPQLPNFSLMTLRRLMFDMGFYYEKMGNKFVLSERQPVDNKDNKEGAAVKPSPVGLGLGYNVPDLKMSQHQHNVPMVMSHHMHPNVNVQQMHLGSENNLIPLHPPVPHMMLNHRRDLMPPPPPIGMGPSNMDMHFKKETPPWIA